MPTAKQHPIFLMAGGPGSRKEGVDPGLARAIQSTGVVHPTIAYIGAASGDDRRFFGWISDLLKKAGAGDVALAPLAKRPDIAKAESIIRSTDLIFVSGGDVEAGMGILDKTGMAALLRSLHAEGRHIMGVSAGAIMLARQWVRWRDPDDDATAETFPCLDCAPIYCDTHGEKDKWEELKALLRLLPGNAKGYGIRSGATISVDAGGKIEVIAGRVDVFAKKNGAIIAVRS